MSLLRAVALSLCALFCCTSVSAQYFGQNKVRYRELDFKVLKTPNFDIYYYDRGKPALDQASRMAERWNVRLSQVLDWRLSSRQPLILYANHPDFRSTTVLPGLIGEGTGGVTESLKRRVVLPMAGPLSETDHVLGHELVHAYQFDIAASRTRGAGLSGNAPGADLPLWFVEGMAEYLTLGPVDAHTAMWLRDAVIQERLPAVKDLDDPKYFPYRFGQAFWAYVGGRWGDEVIGRMFRIAVDRGTDAAIRHLGITPETFSKEWHADIEKDYRNIIRATTPASDEATVLISKDHHGGELNVSPAASPDGKWLALFSERDLFSIDLFLADARTGEIKRKITDLAIDAHLDSLQFVNSAGSWSADSQFFAFGSVSKGVAELSIYSLKQDKVIRSISLPTLGDIYGTTWSPDGKQICVSGVAGGLSDLFLVELESGNVRNLTNDAFGDLHPAWSPTGNTIAFSTDRFRADPQGLSYGGFGIAFINLQTGTIQPGPGFDTGKNINPQWGAQGDRIYFVADPDGISNIYVSSLSQSAQPQRITNVSTGVTGISHLSPSIAVAQQTGALTFSVFRDGDYSILTEPNPTPARSARAFQQAGALPPRDRRTGEVAALLDAPERGLERDLQAETTPYDPDLSLEHVSGPSIGVGVSNYGAVVGGGTVLYFGDLLGYHQLALGLRSTSLSGRTGKEIVRNLSGVVAYQNLKHRWTWGVQGGQTPYVSGAFGETVGVVNGDPAVQQRELRIWQIDRQIVGTASYPFNRAQRIEFAAGYSNIDFVADQRTEVFSLVNGQRLASSIEEVPTPDALNLGVVSSALVYDTSLFAGTSPVRGQRYRLEGGFNGGSLNFGNVLADYRKYFQIARPLSVAGRILHFGRYGSDAENSALQDLFIGYPTLVRGYDVGSFNIQECGGATDGSCPVFDQLLGSRVAVANAEARLAVLGPLGIIPSRRAPPVEASVFYDAGIAWRSFDDIPRSPAKSYGAALRVNIFGFAIGQISYARPVDRPLRAGVWQFAFAPGY